MRVQVSTQNFWVSVYTSILTCTIHSHSMRIFDQSSYQYYLCYEGSYISDHNRHTRVSKSIFFLFLKNPITWSFTTINLVPNARKCQKRVKYPFTYAHKDPSQPSPNNLYECDMSWAHSTYIFLLFISFSCRWEVFGTGP